jgi:hypothetical protein
LCADCIFGGVIFSTEVKPGSALAHRFDLKRTGFTARRSCACSRFAWNLNNSGKRRRQLQSVRGKNACKLLAPKSALYRAISNFLKAPHVLLQRWESAFKRKSTLFQDHLAKSQGRLGGARRSAMSTKRNDRACTR